MLAAAVALAAAALPSSPAHAEDFYGVTQDERLVRFDTMVTTPTAPVPVRGLATGEQIAAIDVRPTTGGLYGIAQLDQRLRLVRIDQATGTLTQVGTAVNLPGTPLGVGFDIKPDDEDAYVVTSTDQAFRFALPGGAVTVLDGPEPSTPQLAGLAWTPDNGGIVGGASLDFATDQLLLGSGSGPWLAFPQPLGVNIGPAASLDFGTSLTLWMYASPTLYRVDAVSGAATQSGGAGTLRAFAVRLSGGIALGAGAYGAGEGDGTVAVTIRRDAPAESAAKVSWSTADGTAVAGRDYTASSGQVTFARGQSRATVNVPLVADGAAEGTERFSVRLASVDGVPAGTPASVLIADDDATAPGGGGADRVAPVVLALPVTRKPARTVKLPFATSEAGTAAITLRLRKKDAKRMKVKRTLATSTGPAAAGANTASLRIPAATVRKLRKRKAVAKATVAVTDAAGNRTASVMKVTFAR
jgi:hypothetical protein